jgi:uncharacterized membrane protein
MQLAVTANRGQSVASNLTPAKAARLLFIAIAVLSLAGMIVSAVSLQRHYAKSTSAFCDFAEHFNCDIVNRSEYSSIMGIPVAGIGVAGYGALFLLASVYRLRSETPNRLLTAAICGFGFALYLTYIEGYVLNTWCILCLSSLTFIAAIAVLAGVLKARAHV